MGFGKQLAERRKQQDKDIADRLDKIIELLQKLLDLKQAK